MECNDYFEINLIELFFYCRKRIWIPVISMVLCAAAVFLGSKIFLTPQYTATTRVYILNRSSETMVYSDLQMSNLLSKDYEALITGRNVTSEVIEELNLPMSDDALSGKVAVSSEDDTRILDISATDSDPQRAALIANAVREVASEQIMSIMEIDAVNLVYEAAAPSSPSSPNIAKNTTLAAIAGLAVAFAGLITAYLLDDTIKTEEDVERFLRMRTLGVIPAFPQTGSPGKAPGKKRTSSTRQDKGTDQDAADRNIVSISEMIEKDFRASEAVKALRTSVIFSGANTKAIALTSCTTAEGKTTVSVELAAALARSGRRTVLLDTDIRKSTLASRLKHRGRRQGLSNFLSGMVHLDEILNQTDIQNFFLIFAGNRAPNPAELLCSPGFSALIQTLKDRFDYIIVDTPPLGMVDDCAVIMPAVDGVLLVVNVQDNSRKVLRRVQHRIDQTNGKLLGVVLNRVDFNEMGGYYGKKNGSYI